MRIRFDGGVDTVTGSRHRLEVNGHRILRDCGLFQGRREEAWGRNRQFEFAPGELDAMVLSHAHIDHCGNIPSLVRQGFRGPIHATDATVQLCDLMLRDAARIQEQDAAYVTQRNARRGLPPVEPLYTLADAEQSMPLFRPHAYGRAVQVAPGVGVTFHDAGHILGAALTVFDLEEAGRRVRVGFAFDLGRKNLPLLRDPEVIRDIDTLVLESTYGNRLHEDARDAAAELRDAVRATFARGGRVLIPSFALERTQEILYHLTALVDAGEIGRTCVIVDSPLAASVTEVFERNPAILDEEYRELRKRVGRVVTPPWVRFVSSVEESKAVTAQERPCIVIAASGMCEHGRILHHLKHGIGNPRNTVLFVGYQAGYTLGRRLVDGEKNVRIFGEPYEVAAEIKVLPAFSAHADRDELVDYVRRVAPRRTFLVHGEPDARAGLASSLQAAGAGEVRQPMPGDSFEL